MIKNNSFKFILFSIFLVVFMCGADVKRVSASGYIYNKFVYIDSAYKSFYNTAINLFTQYDKYLCSGFGTWNNYCYVIYDDVAIVKDNSLNFNDVDVYLWDNDNSTYKLSSSHKSLYLGTNVTFVYLTKGIIVDNDFIFEVDDTSCSQYPDNYLCLNKDSNNLIHLKANDYFRSGYYYLNSPSVTYNVNYYFDNILQESLNYSGVGNVGSTITIENKANEDYLDKGNNTYEVVLKDKDNVFNIYYFSKTYGTNYQQINTDNSQLWLPFSYDYLKSIFPNIDFSLWTSYEQFMFTLVFNILFVILLFLVLYVCYRLFLNIKGWFV